ncbi:hypothetical protein LJR005_001373 [Rossellomorea sp. LjRoot5]
MENKLAELKEAMDSTTHKGRRFTELQKNRIRLAVHRPVELKTPNPFIIFIMTTVALCLIAFFVSTELMVKKNETKNGSPNIVLERSAIILPEDIPTFVQESDFDTIQWDQRAATFGRNLIGNEGKSGIIGADMPSLNGQKWMWHLWGTDASELTVVAYQKDSGTVNPILNNGESWTIPLGGENNGADVHAPSSVTIPEQGEWAFVLYADGKLFDVIVMEITN